MDDFLAWCAERGVCTLAQIRPLHVAAWIEELGRSVAAPTVKQRLAAIRHLFGQGSNPISGLMRDGFPDSRREWIMGVR